jgi:exosortase
LTLNRRTFLSGRLHSAAARHACFLLLCALSVIVYRSAMARLAQLSLHDERYSHIVLTPLISACLIVLNRRRVFSSVRYRVAPGVVVIAAGAILCSGAMMGAPPAGGVDDRFALSILGVVVVWIGGFVLCYGEQAVRAAAFPLGSLALVAPIPTRILDAAVGALQSGSAATAELTFRLLGVPTFRDGFIFSLPGVDVEVAAQCSGIRSSMALLITGGLAGYMGLRSNWARAVLIVCTVPIAVFKNAVRIVSISLLGAYVDAGFLYGRLHRNSGIVFSLLGLALLGLALLVLWKIETRGRGERPRRLLSPQSEALV